MSESPLALASLQTESRNDRSSTIDVVSTLDICRIINEEDSKVAAAVKTCVPEIASTIDLIAGRVSKHGRVIYVGAGTSGRLGVLDASEIPPTFSAPYSQFIALMAGGDSAIRRAAEGAEDSTTLPVTDLAAISPPLSPLDTLIGIAASGRTPYVLAGLSHARDSLGMLTVGISCVKPSEMRGRCECLIECVVGPEVVTGSTRMKAGTATKLILNMISTGVMIRVGKTFGNMMVDVKSSNKKLIDRARRIFRTILPISTLSDIEIDELIKSCHGSVKLALVVGKLGCSIEEGAKRLDAAGGVLKSAWVIGSDSNDKGGELGVETKSPELVLCVDAGGTKCTAVVAGRDGILARAEAGPCNFISLGHDSALEAISAVISQAIAQLSPSPGSLYSMPLAHPAFDAAWIGGAGLGRADDVESIRPRISKLLSMDDPLRLIVTDDAALLSSAITTPYNAFGKLGDIHDVETKTGVVLITGTGCIAFSYAATEGTFIPVPVERAGGWGYLLGDEGSGYSIGRAALRCALRSRDMGLPPTAFHQRIMTHLDCTTVGEIISNTYRSTAQNTEPDPKLRIASLCPIVFDFAFPPSSGAPDGEALSIVRDASAAAADTVLPLLREDMNHPIRSRESTLVMGGGLAQIPGFRDLVVGVLKEKGEVFARVAPVADAPEHAVQLLVRRFIRS